MGLNRKSKACLKYLVLFCLYILGYSFGIEILPKWVPKSSRKGSLGGGLGGSGGILVGVWGGQRGSGGGLGGLGRLGRESGEVLGSSDLDFGRILRGFGLHFGGPFGVFFRYVF